jgi:hypothetical protein
MTVYPTGHQLVHRHIPADDRCIFCGQIERVEQLLLFCPFARRVWEGVKSAFPLHLLRKELHNMKQWMFFFRTKGPPGEPRSHFINETRGKSTKGLKINNKELSKSLV